MDAGSSAADARAIRLEDFVAARSREIASLRAHLSHRYGTQRVFQSVPRHLRRRAASHNIKRLPVRFRAAADAERDRDLANGSQPKDGGRASRRKRRRPGLIRDEYMRRQGTTAIPTSDLVADRVVALQRNTTGSRRTFGTPSA